MSRRDKIGLALLVVTFVLFVIALAWTVRPYSDTVRSPEESIFVQQRMKNIEKSRD